MPSGFNVTEDVRKKLVEAYLSGLSKLEAGKLFGLSTKAVTYALEKYGVETRPQHISQRKYNLNTRFFQTIDTERKAYWLGFLSADAGIQRPEGRKKKESWQINLGLSQKDHNHLEKLATDLEYNHAVKDADYTKHGVSLLNISSKEMVQDLQKYNIGPRKSFTVTPWDGPSHLIHHYWRGVFDGDGHIRFSPTINEWEMGIVGNIFIVTAFSKFIEERTLIPISVKPMQNIYCSKRGGVQSVQNLITILYRDATVWLDRKKLLADECMKRIPIIRKHPKIY